MGLYDDDKTDMKTGDICDINYWQLKFNNMKLQAILKAKQPEGDVRYTILDVTRGAEDLLKEYPNHEEIKAWQASAQKINAKVDQGSQQQGFRGDCEAWGQHSYYMAWSTCGVAKMALDAQDFDKAKGFGQDCVKYLGQAKGFMTNWAPDIKEWVNKTLPEMEKLVEDAKKRT